MDETIDMSDGAEGSVPAVLDVTQIPLLDLAPGDDRVLDSVIRRLVDDVASNNEITAAFGNRI
jgi:FXSXX-COOH protein